MRLTLPSLLVLVAVAPLGCSDPVPPLAKGGWTVQFLQSGTTCGIPSHDTAFGEVNASAKGELVTDGSDGATVSCEIDGGTFSGQARGGGRSLRIDVSGLSADTTFDAPATGQVSFSSSTTAGEVFQGNECNFYFGDSGEQGIGDDQVWLSFQCAAVVSEQATCQIAQGYAAWEDCF